MRVGPGACVVGLAAALVCVQNAGAAFVAEPQFGAANTLTVSWGDADGDGDMDAAVSNSGAVKWLYLNDGTGQFTQTTPFGVPRSTFCLVFGDFDNDGDQDLAEGRQGQVSALWVRNPDGTYTSVNAFNATSRRTIAMAWGDCDADGDLDLAVGNGILGVAQQNYLYRNNGNGTFTEEPQFGTGQTGAVAWADFDLDGDLDLAVGNGGFVGTDQQNFLYVNDGHGVFTERAEFGQKDTASLAWGDFDNDGDPDLAVGNWNAMGSALYVNNGNGTFTGHAEFGDDDTNSIAWGDIDNDGDLDAATANGDFTSAGQNFLYLNQGGGVFLEQAEFGLSSTDGVSFADCDGDFDLDAAIGNEHSPTQNYLYRNASGGSALIVHLVGHRHDQGTPFSNRDGIGARIEAFDAGHAGEGAHRIAVREISANGGFAAQNAVDAHFGLQTAAAVDLVIHWPGSGGSRITQTVANVAAGQRITVHETMPASSVDQAVSSIGQLFASPNPTTASITFAPRSSGLDSRIAAGLDLRLEIRDASGRKVRDLSLSGSSSTGLLPVTWDGIDTEGHRAPPGVYFARVLGTRNLEPVRVVVLR